MRRAFRTVLLPIAALALSMFASACGSNASSGGAACQTHTDCSRGEYCTLNGVCAEQACQTAAQCSGGVGVVCLEDLGLCSAAECVTDAAVGEEGSCEAGFYCLNGTCLADGTGPSTDIVEPGDASSPTGDTKLGDEDSVAGDDAGSTPQAAGCASCEEDADCGTNMTCEPLGASKHCLAACENDGQCDAGWICYPATNEGNVCIPAAYSCDADCLTAGCSDGQVCDQDASSETFGQCVAALGECTVCSGYDWQCGEGFRCALTNAGKQFCVPECPDGTCADWASCQEKGGVGGVGVMICMPTNAACCGPDCQAADCDPACAGRFGICYNGQCVQCLDDNDCAASGGTCDQASHGCVGGLCDGTPSTPYELDGQCVECAEDSHCPSGTCLADHTCDGVDPCGGQCVDPYPACASVNGTWSCVQCAADSDCTTGDCDETRFQCVGGPGPEDCNQDCVLNGCPSSADFTLQCDSTTGCCYDTSGLCDNVTAFCNTATGSECVSIFDVFMGGAIPGGALPGMPSGGTGFAGGMCSCDAAGSALCNLLPDNPLCESVPRCYDGASCMPISTLMQLLMGGSGGGAVLFQGDICSASL